MSDEMIINAICDDIVKEIYDFMCYRVVPVEICLKNYLHCMLHIIPTLSIFVIEYNCKGYICHFYLEDDGSEANLSGYEDQILEIAKRKIMTTFENEYIDSLINLTNNNKYYKLIYEAIRNDYESGYAQTVEKFLLKLYHMNMNVFWFTILDIFEYSVKDESIGFTAFLLELKRTIIESENNNNQCTGETNL